MRFFYTSTVSNAFTGIYSRCFYMFSGGLFLLKVTVRDEVMWDRREMKMAHSIGTFLDSPSPSLYIVFFFYSLWSTVGLYVYTSNGGISCLLCCLGLCDFSLSTLFIGFSIYIESSTGSYYSLFLLWLINLQLRAAIQCGEHRSLHGVIVRHGVRAQFFRPNLFPQLNLPSQKSPPFPPIYKRLDWLTIHRPPPSLAIVSAQWSSGSRRGEEVGNRTTDLQKSPAPEFEPYRQALNLSRLRPPSKSWKTRSTVAKPTGVFVASTSLLLDQLIP